jgi:signal transduction histidine kinase
MALERGGSANELRPARRRPGTLVGHKMAYVPVPRQRRGHENAGDINTLCHDLRQCLTAGLLLSQLPKDNLLDAETRRRFELIQQTLTHAGALLESARDAEEPRPWLLDLTELVEECAAVAEFGHKIRLDREVTGAALVAGDPLLLRRAIDNMIDNAGRAAGESGEIVIRLGASDDETWVEVTDDGPGFGRIEHGTGQGLSVVSSAVHACDGRLEISSGPGRGTSVRVTVPRRHSTANAAAC